MITATTQRAPAVAGMFYPGDPASLRDELAQAASPLPSREAEVQARKAVQRRLLRQVGSRP